jgi:hypothetical protein
LCATAAGPASGAASASLSAPGGDQVGIAAVAHLLTDDGEAAAQQRQMTRTMSPDRRNCIAITACPAPNFGDPLVLVSQNYRETRSGMVQHQPTYTNRIDHRFSEKMFVFGRWTATRWNQDNYETGLPLFKDTMRTERRQMDCLTIALTNTF